MISVRCPECGSRLEVDDEHAGQDVRCPACRAVFAARPDGVPEARPSRRGPDDYDDQPRRSRDDYDDDDYDRPRRRRTRQEMIDDARRTVFLPALLSVIACIVTIGYHVLDMAIVLANPQMLQNNPFMKAGNNGGFQWTPEMYAGARVFSILWQLVTLAGSFAMMRMKARPFAMTAMVLQVIPCGAGICCILGLPIGIWGLVVMNRPEVKDAFDWARTEPSRLPARERNQDRSYDDEEDDRWRER